MFPSPTGDKLLIKFPNLEHLSVMLSTVKRLLKHLFLISALQRTIILTRFPASPNIPETENEINKFCNKINKYVFLLLLAKTQPQGRSYIKYNASIQADKGLQKKLGKCNVVSSAPQSLYS